MARSLVQDPRRVSTFASHTAWKTLTHSIRFGSANRRASSLNAARCTSKLSAQCAVTIADQEARTRVERRGFAKRLGNPNVSWGGWDSERHDTTGTQARMKKTNRLRNHRA